MSNGDDPVIVCCILGLCCAARSAKQRAAVMKMIRHQRPKLNLEQAEKATDRLLIKYNYFEDVPALLDAA